MICISQEEEDAEVEAEYAITGQGIIHKLQHPWGLYGFRLYSMFIFVCCFSLPTSTSSFSLFIWFEILKLLQFPSQIGSPCNYNGFFFFWINIQSSQVGFQASLSVSVGSQIGDEVVVRVEEAHPRDDFLELKEVIWGIQRDSFGWKLSSKKRFFPYTGFVFYLHQHQSWSSLIFWENENLLAVASLFCYRMIITCATFWSAETYCQTAKTSLFKKNVHKHRHLQKQLPVLRSMTSIHWFKFHLYVEPCPRNHKSDGSRIASRHFSFCRFWLIHG